MLIRTDTNIIIYLYFRNKFCHNIRLSTVAAVDTYHIHDLYQIECEVDGERKRIIGHWSLHPVVVLQEVLQQVPLVRTLQRH